jgi:thiol:disulfide interchange protein DsbA
MLMLNPLSLVRQALRVAAALFTALTIGAAFAQGPAPRDGIMRLDPPQPIDSDGKVEVLEFFAYGCIHCANLEPQLHAWSKKLPDDVKVIRVPANIAVRGINSIPIYYTLEAMREIDRLHTKIFEAIHNENVNLGHKPTLLKWLEKNGVDPKKYEDVERSFSVVNRIRRAEKMTNDYKLPSTPVMVINGRILVEPTPSAPPILTTVDRLIVEARNSMANRAAPAKASAPASTPAKAAPAKAAPAPAPAK